MPLFPKRPRDPDVRLPVHRDPTWKIWVDAVALVKLIALAWSNLMTSRHDGLAMLPPTSSN
jgi:hypothetical protein